MTNFFYIVATPIGNLADITFRAVDTLKNVDFILAEDSRVSGKLLKKYNIEKKMISYNSFSTENKKEKIFKLLEEGKNLALITDAGTPTISDPGVKIVEEIYQKFFQEIEKKTLKVESIPGPSALICAASLCGFSVSEFVFYGFLPHKKGRETIFKEIAENKKTSIFYESPNRVLKSLNSLENFLKEDRKIFVARELTKIYEEKISGTAKELKDFFEKNPQKLKGEFVIVVEKK